MAYQETFFVPMVINSISKFKTKTTVYLSCSALSVCTLPPSPSLSPSYTLSFSILLCPRYLPPLLFSQYHNTFLPTSLPHALPPSLPPSLPLSFRVPPSNPSLSSSPPHCSSINSSTPLLAASCLPVHIDAHITSRFLFANGWGMFVLRENPLELIKM